MLCCLVLFACNRVVPSLACSICVNLACTRVCN